MSSPFVNGKFQGVSSSGPISGGLLYTYAAGTTTPQATYTDSTLGTPNANPVVLDSEGRASVWLGASSYRAILKTAAGATVWDVDNITDPLTALADTSSISKGDALIGVKLNATGAVARTQHAKNAESVSVLDFGADPTGSVDSTSAIMAAVTAVSTLGGTVYVPAGTYKLTGLITLANNVSLLGDGPRASIFKQYGAAFCVKMAVDGNVISKIGFRGTVSATGAVDFSGNGLGKIEDFDIQDFTATGACAIKMVEVYRSEIDFGYIYNCYNGIVFSGAVTTVKVTKTNFGVISNRALDGSSGGVSYSVVGFDTCYFESCSGTSPIYFNTGSRIVFYNCGFEHMASGANASVIRMDVGRLEIRSSQWSGFNTGAITYTGTCQFLYCGPSLNTAIIDDLDIVQNFTISGFTGRFIYGIGNSSISISNSRVVGSSFASSALESFRFLVSGMDVTYRPACYQITNVLLADSSAINKGSGTISRLTTTFSSSAASATAFTYTFPARTFGAGDVVKVSAWGRRAGTTNTKRALLNFTAGGSSSVLIASAVTAASDWHGQAIITFASYSSEKLTAVAFDAAASSVATSVVGRDTAANDITVSITTECVSGSDTMYVDGVTIEWL